MSNHSKSRNNYSKSESNCYNCKEKTYYFSTEGKPSNLSVLNCNYDNNYDTNGGWDSFIEQNPNLIPNEESSGENDELPEEFNQKLFHLSHGYPSTCSIKDSSFGPKREYR